MIPTTWIAFQPDGTAWWCWRANEAVDGETGENYLTPLDRSCGTCGGAGRLPSPWSPEDFANEVCRCPDCINGRHTFTIATYCEQQCDFWPCPWANDQGFNPQCNAGVRSLRVSVVPGMIAQIVGIGEATTETQYPFITPKVGGGWVLHHIPRAMAERTPITLPSDAKPGGWAVQLRVAT